jgi:prepilin-type N-terminal cleavage/methylation domain-containing protein
MSKLSMDRSAVDTPLRPHLGFTLLEILLSVSMIAILAAITLPIQRIYFTKNALVDTSNILVSSLRQAESFARASVDDSEWGLHVSSATITLFEGTDFATRDTEKDIAVSVPSNIGISGTTEYFFSKATGLPTAAGATTLTNIDGNARTITVSDHGVITVD